MLSRSIVQAACVLVLISAAAPAWAQATLDQESVAYAMDIPSQDLHKALQLLALVSNHKLFYPSTLVRGKVSPPIRGRFTAHQALEVLLENTRLSFEITASSVVVIRSLPEVKAETQAGAPGSGPLATELRAIPLEVGKPVISEILVTARRRNEELQNVPISLAVFDSDDLSQRSVENLGDLDVAVSNVAIAGGNFFGNSQGTLRVRGVPGVAVYVDGVVRSSQQGLLGSIVELERVEILRGPQGTLFGKNAIGGAVQLLTKRPVGKLGGRLSTAVGSSDRLDLVANIDLPLGENLLTKFAGATLNRDGYMKSTSTGYVLGSQADRVGRATFDWQAAGQMNVLITAEYASQNSNGKADTVFSPINAVCPGDPLPEKWAGTAPNSVCVYNLVGLPVDGIEAAHGARKEWNTGSDRRGPGYFNDSSGISAEVRWDLSRGGVLKLISGYRELDWASDGDFDGTAYNIFQSQNSGERREYSNELQWQYVGDSLQGTMGLYQYFNSQRTKRLGWIANELSFEPYLSRVNQLIGSGFMVRTPSSIINTLTENQNEGWATFSEWTWGVTPRLAVTGGIRFTRDTISTAAFVPFSAPAQACCARDSNLDPLGPSDPRQSGSERFSQWTPRLSMQYRWSPDWMAYMTYSEGFGAGGFSGGSIPGLENGGFRSYGPETLTNIEIGLRSRLFERRLLLNATYFYGIWDDIQISEELPEVPFFPLTTNAGQAHLNGIEIESVWKPIEPLTMNASAGWLNSHYTELGRTRNLTLNTPLAYAPEFTYSVGGQYEWRIDEGAGLLVRLDYGWQDKVQTTTDVNGSTLQEAYGLLGARVTYRKNNAPWEIAVFGTNLTNVYYRIGGQYIPNDQLDTGVAARPREWGASFKYSW